MKAKHSLAAAALLAMAIPALAGLREDLAAKEAEVATLRQNVAVLTQSLLVKDVDLRTFVSLSPLVEAVAGLNSRPVPGRLINVRSTAANGQFWHDGATWCHSFVELKSADGMWADVVLDNFSANLRDDGGIELNTRAAVNGKVQVKFQFMGPRTNIYALGVKVGNFCPPGGGIGTSIGVGFQKVQPLALLLSFSRAADGRSIAYSVQFTAPAKVDVSAKIGLGAIGTITHPLSLDIPKTPLASGTLPLLFSNEGVFKLPGEAGSRAYSVVLIPKSFVADRKGIVAAWKSTVQFKPVTK